MVPIGQGIPVRRIVHLRRHAGPGIVPTDLDHAERTQALFAQIRSHDARPLVAAVGVAKALSGARHEVLSVGNGETAAALRYLRESGSTGTGSGPAGAPRA